MQRIRFASLLGALAVVFVCCIGPALAEPRVALVIGNSNYGGDLGVLGNPANDARLIAKTLAGIGFQVIETEDADQAAMKQAISDFGTKLANAGDGATGLFFYAGHGLQVGGVNYLIPIHAKIDREPDADMQAVPVDLVLKQMDYAGSAVNIVILDACRNNPLSKGFRSMTHGLAEPSVKPRGSFIAYATAPGDVAEDGNGDDSPYSLALSQAMTQPGLSLNDMFQNVRGQVLTATNQKQTPWDSSSLTAPFYFVPAAAPAATTATATPAPAVDDKEIELTFWKSVKDSKSPEDFQAYLDKYPNGDFAPIAKIRVKELSAPAPAQAVAAAAPPAAPAVSTPAPQSGAAQISKVQPAAPAAPSPVASAAADPKDVETCTAHGDSDPGARESACRRALDSGDADPKARSHLLNGLGVARRGLGDLAAAEQNYRAAIEADPDNALAYRNLGLVLASRDNFPDARDAFTKATTLAPGDAATLADRGMAAAFSGDFDAGIADLTQAHAMDPRDALTVEWLIRAHTAKGDLKAMKADLADKVAAGTINHAQYGAAAAYMSGSLDEASRILAHGMKEYPKAPIFYMLQIVVQEARHDKPAAQAADRAAKGSLPAGDWHLLLLDAMLGDMSETDFDARFKADNPDQFEKRSCSTGFYFGELALIAGDKDKGRADLQRVVDCHFYYYGEYGLSKMRLAQLDAK